ncbi:MAG: hypothetical protein ACXVA9_06575 [Bdellovibrionales bacterium]
MITLIFALLTQASALEAKSKSAHDGSNPVFAERIHANNQIEIVSYDQPSDSYKIIWEHLTPQESRIFATPENLVKAVHSLSLAAIRKNPSSLVGNIYSTDSDLDVVDHVSLATNPRFATIRPAPREPQSRGPASVKPAKRK